MFGIDSDNLTVCVIFTFVFLLTYYFLKNRGECSNLPPGPTSYPFVGNIPQFVVGKHFIQTLREFRKKYGNIFTVNMPGKRTIVIGGYDNIKDAFVRQGSAFSDRPPLPNSPFKGYGLIFANGEIWKHNRRFAIHTLRDFGMGKNQLQISIHDEIGYFLDAIEEYGGQPFDIQDLLNIAVSNIICSMVFGKRFDYHDETFLSYVHAVDELAKDSPLMKSSWFKYIPGDPFGMVKTYRVVEFMESFYKTKINEHLRDFDAHNIRDLIDAYIKEMKENGEQSFMNTEDLVRIVHDLFGAGTETTTTTLRYGLMYLLQNPDIQTRLSSDIQNNVPCNRLPNLSDKPKLPYLDAAIYEMLRRSCLIPFGGPRLLKEEIEFKGYKLPKSAMILPDLESVLMDDVLWDKPQIFNPSRFLNENMKLINTEYVIPFSVGPRVCLAEGLAKTELYLFLSAMLQRFKFLPPEGETPTTDIIFGVVCSPKPFRLRAIKK